MTPIPTVLTFHQICQICFKLTLFVFVFFFIYEIHEIPLSLTSRSLMYIQYGLKQFFFLSPSSIYLCWMVTYLWPHHMAFTTFPSQFVLHVFVIMFPTSTVTVRNLVITDIFFTAFINYWKRSLNCISAVKILYINTTISGKKGYFPFMFYATS